MTEFEESELLKLTPTELVDRIKVQEQIHQEREYASQKQLDRAREKVTAFGQEKDLAVAEKAQLMLERDALAAAMKLDETKMQ